MNIKSHFKFNKQERSGVFFLLLLIILLQVAYFAVKAMPLNNGANSLSEDVILQDEIDSLKKSALETERIKIYPFNPNFITDYKGYTLGMSIDEIDRLHSFRATNSYVNSSKEFQQVTQVSDSLLKIISPYFKFPEWNTRKKSFKNQHINKYSTTQNNQNQAKEIVVKDLNTVTEDELKLINGIGDKLSKRIIKFRNRLGGFIIDEQLYDVYYLEPEVAHRILSNYKVLTTPVVQKININNASVEAIASLVYINYDMAKKIVSYRGSHGPFFNLDELSNIEDFPKEKITRIALYLSL